jgi:hypothetical protein
MNSSAPLEQESAVYLLAGRDEATELPFRGGSCGRMILRKTAGHEE